MAEIKTFLRAWTSTGGEVPWRRMAFHFQNFSSRERVGRATRIQRLEGTKPFWECMPNLAFGECPSTCGGRDASHSPGGGGGGGGGDGGGISFLFLLGSLTSSSFTLRRYPSLSPSPANDNFFLPPSFSVACQEMPGRKRNHFLDGRPPNSAPKKGEYQMSTGSRHRWIPVFESARRHFCAGDINAGL